MSTIEAKRQGSSLTKAEPTWQQIKHGMAYQCRIILCPESTGGYSAHAIDLPGVVSQGESVAEATENVVAAFRETIKVYAENGLDIPWGADHEFECPANAIQRWVVVNV